MKPQILVITSVYPRSPTDRYGSFIQETVVRLQETGMKLTVFAPAFEGSNHQLLDGVSIHRFRYFFKSYENLTHGEGAPTKINNPLYLLIAFFYILAGTWQCFGVCRQKKPDFIHVHWPFPHGLMAFPSSYFLKIPMIFSFHGAELLLASKFCFVAFILKRLLPYAKRVTANSSFTQGLISQLSPKPVSIIPYGLTLTAKQPKPRLVGEVPRLLFVGRLIERKGLRYLLAALPLILAECPVRLRVVGTGDEWTEIQQLCKKLEIQDIIDFLGVLSNEELAEEYASCDIFVLPSIVNRKGDTEGLGIVMIEALAHCKPVVATDVGGIADVIRSGETGLLVDEKNPSALAQAILSLLHNPKLAQQMGEKGLADVQSRFSWSRLILLWQDIFQF
jgi:glycosyltransferase involved in cell wall biosynthesis